MVVVAPVLLMIMIVLHGVAGTELTKWSREDGGFDLHVLSSVTEWICASCIMIYLLLFIWDFEEISLSEPEIFVHDNFTVPANLRQRKSSDTA